MDADNSPAKVKFKVSHPVALTNNARSYPCQVFDRLKRDKSREFAAVKDARLPPDWSFSTLRSVRQSLTPRPLQLMPPGKMWPPAAFRA